MRDLRALPAARLAMVEVLVFLPPVTELMRLLPTEVATEDAALLTAFCPAFLTAALVLEEVFLPSFPALAASFSASFSAFAASLAASFSALAASFSAFAASSSASFWALSSSVAFMIISYALSRSTLSRYLRSNSSAAMTLRTKLSSAAPMRLCGGRMRARSTISGMPFSSRQLTSACPTPSAMMASSVANSGLTRNAFAAARTAFCSAGV